MHGHTGHVLQAEPPLLVGMVVRIELRDRA